MAVIPPAAQNGENIEQNARLERPSETPACEISESCAPEMDMNCHIRNGATDHSVVAGVSSGDKAAVNISSDITANTTFHLNPSSLDPRIDAEAGKISKANYEIRPFLRMIAGSSASELDLNGNVYKIFEEQRELLKDLESHTALPSTRCLAFKDSLKQGILSADEIQVSFDDFPYYLRLVIFAKMCDILFRFDSCS